MKQLLCLLLLLSATQPASALPEAEIQRFIDDAIKAGGGEVIIPPGVHLIERGLMLKDAKKLRLIGLDAEETVLKLPPVAYAIASGVTEGGATRIAVKTQRGFKPGMRLKIEADGETDSFTKKPKPYHLAIVKAVERDVILLETPLKFPVPDGTMIRHEDAPNLIEIRGASEEVRIEKLTLDGGRMESDPPIRGHAQLCGIFAAGAYSYEKGPTGPQVKKLHISRCFIQNCHGRGIALYSVESAEIDGCTIRDTSDEAIDFDHFTVKSIATHNHIARSLIGVELNDATNCLVAGNDFRECATGINLWRWCKQPGLNEGNLIVQNVFERTKGNAVQIATGTRGNTIAQNEISGSGKNGIVLSGEGQIVKANQITGSGMKAIAINEGKHEIVE
ncbi:right-handed parallel beta-helix repeat-containing protein [Prosthecobacter sp.]|uniref:right-handed parallel beta-helix repeat-containing protein n=1 Tax=Prosthecobacter sp. TaxID=1965333 RepID=UPI002ABB51E4|nr:right-handed parallel beta-helix repeat-containing protein [Prosthecobacter sp.]MDZ4404348.1 right-handed parallel beta-helix repeat-containing protein [Prosthecobacter sp.]